MGAAFFLFGQLVDPTNRRMTMERAAIQEDRYYHRVELDGGEQSRFHWAG